VGVCICHEMSIFQCSTTSLFVWKENTIKVPLDGM